MIPVSTQGIANGILHDLVGRVSRTPVQDAERGNTIRVLTSDPEEELGGYVAVLTSATGEPATHDTPTVSGCTTNHLDDGDVLVITPRGLVRTAYRRRSSANALFATDRCNSLCVMCSQPPKDVDDTGRVTQLLRIVSLVNPATAELGITGGEPTLLGQGLLDVIAACRDRLPATVVHLLSNGRAFSDSAFAQALGAICHPDLMVGIPLYSDIDSHHDYVVQAKGAFAETILGLLNLARAEVPVEIRIVVHRDTYERLPQLAQFIYRNLTFASHVTFMGLEVIGLAKANIASLWIDPADYMAQLEQAAMLLARTGMRVSIYNHQLCTLPPALRELARQSISDWKREYLADCDACDARPDCTGFFAWNIARHRSRLIHPL